MKKKQLTPTQKKRKFNTISKICYFSEYISMAAPFLTIGLVNYDKYFIEYNGTKMSISFVMALIVLGFTVWSVTKKKLADSLWSLALKMGILSFICYLMGSLITDLATILFFGCIGVVGSQLLDGVSKNYKIKRDKIIQAMDKADLDRTAEEYKEELKNGK